MQGITELLAGRLNATAMSGLGRAIGADQKDAAKAVSAALPLLLGALSRNAASPEGAAALHGALARDHDGSILDDVTRALGGATESDGAKILRHAFGAKQPKVEAGVAQVSGLDGAQVTKLMATLAPLVLGALGKTQRDEGLDVDGLSKALSAERASLEKTSVAGSLMSGLLDRDGDGSVMDDLGSIGAGLLRGFTRGSN